MLGESDRRNIVLGSIVILILVMACLATILAYKQVVPSNVDRDTITITRADYEQALEKWRTRNVAEYEITVRRDTYEATLRVSDGERNIQMLKRLDRDRDVTKSGDMNFPTDLLQMTVGNLFSLVDGSLTSIENVDVPHTSDDGSTTFYDYEIKLDQNFGYPTHIAGYKRVTRQSREITWREKTQDATDVVDFKVLR